MSSYFGEQEEKNYIPPDYTDATESVGPSEDDDLDDDDLDDDLDDIDDDEDEGKIETILDEQETKCNKIMQSTPFGSPNPSPTPSWGSQGTTWGSGGNNTPVFGSNTWGQGNNTSPWGQRPSTTPVWGSGIQNNTSTNGKTELDRSKKVIFIDFLDAIVETYQSNGLPGLSPRDIYDVKPRFDVWQKLGAFNPERIYAIIPKNLLKDSTGLPEGLNIMMSYYCCSLAAFLRLPFECCQILVQSRIGQPKEDIISSIMTGINNDQAVLIGINSGMYGQSNSDLIAAQKCNITYYDLNQLLNNMY